MAEPERVPTTPFASSREAVIDVDRTPHGIAVSGDGSRVYVTHFLSGVVSVIDTADLSVTGTLRRSPGLYGIAVGPQGDVVYVANPSSGSIHRIGVSDEGLDISAGVGVTPYGLAMGSDGRLFAACPLEDSIEVLDGLVKNTARVRESDFAVAVAVGPDGTRLYVTNYFSGAVSVIDAASIEPGRFTSDAKVLVRASVEQSPYGVTVSPDGAHVFVGHFGSTDLISVLDAEDLSTVGALHSGRGPVRGVAISPDGSRLYTTDYFSSSVSVLRLQAP